ncbi:MAG: sigma 54-interacting transcriptional regulator, partial [Candidatus Accumulibacter sp.]|nr:sigma 54-interacting transcriptional regulator [Accumulibacter sp.]
AEGGTLFLDEIGDMPAELQTRLLRVLSDGSFYRVGGHFPIRANVRIIAATHQNLDARVGEGLFREDLFHRLNVIRVRLPSLRERREDIPALIRHFLQKSARELGVDAKRISGAALLQLSAADFPGNVRQLENVCHWLTVMAPGQRVDVGDLPPELYAATPASDGDDADWKNGLAQTVDRMLALGDGPVHEKLIGIVERILIERALAHTGGRRVEAALALGIGRNTITRKIQELGL